MANLKIYIPGVNLKGGGGTDIPFKEIMKMLDWDEIIGCGFEMVALTSACASHLAFSA